MRMKLKFLFTSVLVLILVVGSTGTALANLAGSTFEGNDGNLVVNTAGNTDWVNVAGRITGTDKSADKTDNAFGQGTKEDDPNVTIVTGSIPPNKNDLTRFYVASEFVNGSNFLYLAWERLVNIGNANLDLEINQNSTSGFTSTATGPITLNRTAGDLLVTYDFAGSGTPTLGLVKWLTAASGAAASDCRASNALPCWGAVPADDALDGVDDNRINLTAAGFAEGAVNTGTISEPIAGGTLTAGLFGEAAINLTSANVFPPGTCEAFGSTFLKSRSSSSFGAEMKDFIAPQPMNISNCGKIIIKKVTVPSPDPTNTSFAFTLNGGGNPAPTGTTFPKTFSLKNGESNETQVFAGSGYSAAETVPANWVLTSATCDDGSPVTNINVSTNETVTCTFTNTLQLGAIQVHKTDSKTGNNLAGAVFSIAGQSVTTDANGFACVDHLTFGSYTVQETSAPSGYSADDTTAHSVTVDNNATCADSPFVGETLSFSDTPLSDIQVNFRDGGSGVTSATISCDNTTGTGDDTAATGWDTSRTVTGVHAPTTITCTIVIDP